MVVPTGDTLLEGNDLMGTRDGCVATCSSGTRSRAGRGLGLVAGWVAAVAVLAAMATSCSPRAGGPPASEPAVTGPSKIVGRVTATDTGEPVASVQVVVFDLEGNQAAPPGNTDAGGNYTIELAPGRYRVAANYINPARPLGWNGFGPMWNGGRPVDDPAAVVEVKPGEEVRLDFRLIRVRQVRGKVKTSDGGPIAQGSNVAALDAALGRFLAQVDIAPDGSYEIALPDGEWYLRFTVPGYVQRVSFKVHVAGEPMEVATQELQRA